VGDNARILSERAVEPVLYSDWPLTVELRENIHLHCRNWRPVVDKQQFIQITDAFARARARYDELGQPEEDLSGPTLGETKLTSPLHKDRTALELCTDGTVHFHFDDMRLHIDKRTFVRLGLLFREALQEYSKHESVLVKISEVDVGDIVHKVYLPWLQSYDLSSTPPLNPEDFPDVLLESKRLLRPEDEQRYSDGWLKNPLDGTEIRTRSLPEDFDKRYLCTMLESIKKYGYGEGPYKYDYIRAHLNEKDHIYLTGSHRVACLIHLGYNEIPVLVTN
jgi:hypothetical protein